MLADIKIENFALIDEMEIQLHRGLNIVTGESGSGKSIFVESLNFVLGERTKTAKISSEKTIRVQARFELDKTYNDEIILHLKEQGILEEDSGVLILTRKMYPSGRNLYHINGEMVPFKLYRNVGQHLVDIHGQRDSHFLLNIENQRKVLDLMGDKESEEMLSCLKELYNKYHRLENEISGLKAQELERNRQVDWIKHEIEEIDSASLEPGEEERLEQEKLLLENAEKIVEFSTSVYDGLSGESGALDQLGEVSRILNQWSSFDAEIEKISLNMDNVLEELQEISFISRDKGENIDFAPDTLDNVNQRQHQIDRLKRKYGVNIEEILEYREKALKKLESLQHSSSRIETLGIELSEIKSQWLNMANRLSGLRKKTAVKLEGRILEELNSLGMESAAFEIRIGSEKGDKDEKKKKEFRVTPYGFDKVEFQFGPNPGVPVKSLSLIASGGEMSRVMLAFRNIFSSRLNLSTLILDEIDMGLGGVSAGVVGKKLKEISSCRQIISITHLPIIAALGDRHFRVEKIMEEDSTKTQLTLVSGTDRVEEVMRMLSGEKSPDVTRKLAKKLIENK